MSVHKHAIHRYSHFVRMRGHGLVVPHNHPHNHHHLHNEHLSHHLKHLHLGRVGTTRGAGTAARRHDDYDSEPEGAIIHNRNGRHHKEKHHIHRHKAIKPLQFKI